MATDEKISTALKSAIMYLENSILALDKKDESSFADSIWHVAAELEYALFLFSIKFPDESDLLKWKPNPELKKIETSSILTELRNLLNETERLFISERWLDAYKSAYIARHYLLKVQEDLNKKRREILKKQS
jgi:hypothetical protein